MIAEARIREEIKPIEGFDSITALRATAIRQLVVAGKIQLSLFDGGSAESEPSPGERLIVCKNPLIGHTTRQEAPALLEATNALGQIVAATTGPSGP